MSKRSHGIIYCWFAKWFGANWTTSISGYVTAGALLIYNKPQVIHWIHEPLQGIIWNVSEYVTYAGVIALGHAAKSRMVKGGRFEQDRRGKVRKCD